MLVGATADALRALSPMATLERGYAVARTADGRIVRDPSTLAAGDALQVLVERGTVDGRVERTRLHDDATEELLR
jgi:exodeoxyribonuclease VII large subunit